jgi:hypothetical protein
MEKYLIFIIPLFIWGCSKQSDTVIDSGTTNYQVTNVSSFPTFLYVPGDSSIVATLSFNSSAGIASVHFNIVGPDGNDLSKSSIPLYDDGNYASHGDATAEDNTYSNKFPFSQSYLNGQYTIRYYFTDIYNKTVRAAEHSFYYSNGLADIAPVVSNLVAPDTVTLDTTATTNIPISIQAADSNGLKDIYMVFFNSFLPNGNPSSNNPFVMYDDGNPDHGDAKAGDGTYSLIISLPKTGVTKGTYRWDFQAKDRAGKSSNIITHNIVVK